ncbi:unnamed protein product, partial [Brachionus calyciflorus]
MTSKNNLNVESNPLVKFIGSRVVRGPGWKWGEQDGGEGHVGTIKDFKSVEEVVVVWDNGTLANYRCSGEFDIRIFEPSPCGLYHENIKCNECGQDPLYGIRWVCADCLANENKNINLCSKCYHDDKHQLKHRFYRILTSASDKVLIESRKKSKKISYKGIYPGAKVVRGIDWSWDSQDYDSKGKVIQIKDWNQKSPLGGVYVQWENGIRNFYQMNLKEMSHLRSVKDAIGGYFYKDHLPVLGDNQFKKFKKNTQDLRSDSVNKEVGDFKMREINGSKNTLLVTKLKNSETFCLISDSNSLKLNDRVTINLDFEIVQSLQAGHGGWCQDMVECLGNSGIITGVKMNSDFEVTYPSGNKWIINPAVLTLAEKSTIKHDQNSNNNNLVTDNSNESKCSIQNSNLIDFNNNLSKNTEITNLDVQINSDHHGESPEAMLPVILLTCDLNEELVKAAANGDLEKCEYILGLPSADVNCLFSGHSAIHAASQNGHLEIIKLLIRYNVDVELEDKDGDRAIHHAAFGNEPKVIELLCNENVIDSKATSSKSPIDSNTIKSKLNHLELNSRNKKMQTALHIAVNKGHIDVVKVLLNLGAHTSLQDIDGDTPLHDAITKKNYDIIKLLLDDNADVST